MQYSTAVPLSNTTCKQNELYHFNKYLQNNKIYHTSIDILTWNGPRLRHYQGILVPRRNGQCRLRRYSFICEIVGGCDQHIIFCFPAGPLIMGWEWHTASSLPASLTSPAGFFTTSTNLQHQTSLIRASASVPNSSGHTFHHVHCTARSLGISTFAHLPSGAILVCIAETVNISECAAKISKKTLANFTELQTEKAGLTRMVAALMAVQRKGANGDEDDEEND
ncbi:hypothetical protein GGX14DRAFT_385475 [Mycena pura]|uniref:Uncharacterized protein n=1 Tax=Mycena pura TaxID=153505 RepID=A0AAD6YUB6_9AGAR|nr:hypothetical protein GGX14DRAFT_385475 [Mycena pura]